jgi:hypothetical protein
MATSRASKTGSLGLIIGGGKINMKKAVIRAVGVAIVLAALMVSVVAAQPPVPLNDLCWDAIPVNVPSGPEAWGSTVGATTDHAFPFCGTSITSPGVWYTVVGTGNVMTASTCELDSQGTADYDSKISVYCARCDQPICIGGNDDVPGCNWHSTVRWCSQKGVTYYILVHGWGGATGNFELAVFDGDPCDDPIPCPLPVGGVVLPADKLALLAPWLGLVALLAAGGVALARVSRRRA